MDKKNTIGVEDTLHEIIARAIKRDDFVLTPDTTFKGLGADSLEVVQILVNIEDAFDIELVDKELEAITDMSQLIDYIKKKTVGKNYLTGYGKSS
jgi:acyl carrier protein